MIFKYFNPNYQPKLFDFHKEKFKKLSLKEQAEYLPNFVNAYILAQISQLCYKSSVNAEHTDKNYRNAVRWTLMNSGISYDDAKKTQFLNNSGTQGLIIFHENTAIIAFRGSEKKFNDWAYNATIKRVDFPYEINDSGNGEERIHKGFLEAFQAVIPEPEEDQSKLDIIINKLKECDNIWFTGHSLGGAIAIVAASYFVKTTELIDKIKGIYTFGAPRIGNADYRNYINIIFKNKYWRFMHDHDVVPDLPPTHILSGYSREGCMLRLKERNDKSEYELLRIINEDGERKRYGETYKGFSSHDHDITEYANRLLELIEQQSELIEQQKDKENDKVAQNNKLEFSPKSLKKEKLLEENPEVLMLKVDILIHFRELIENKNNKIDIDLEAIAEKFKISSNLKEIVEQWDLKSNDLTLTR